MRVCCSPGQPFKSKMDVAFTCVNFKLDLCLERYVVQATRTVLLQGLNCLVEPQARTSLRNIGGPCTCAGALCHGVCLAYDEPSEVRLSRPRPQHRLPKSHTGPSLPWTLQRLSPSGVFVRVFVRACVSVCVLMCMRMHAYDRIFVCIHLRALCKHTYARVGSATGVRACTCVRACERARVRECDVRVCVCKWSPPPWQPCPDCLRSAAALPRPGVRARWLANGSRQGPEIGVVRQRSRLVCRYGTAY